jgi:hypothetical protein
VEQKQLKQLTQLVDEALSDARIEALISIWSMRPPPLSGEGKAWEQGARWGWEHAHDDMSAAARNALPVDRWIGVDEQMPPNGRRVMFSWLNTSGKRRTSIGRYAAARSIEEYDEDNDGATNDYDEEMDKYYAHEGWHEMPVESEHYYAVSGTVTHWKALPPPPEDEPGGVSVDAGAEASTAESGVTKVPRHAFVPTEPDVALLASMATCLDHGFGLQNAKEQERTLYDMRKLHDEVVGLGYYRRDNRSRYLDWLHESSGGSRTDPAPLDAALANWVAGKPEGAGS